MEVIKPFMSNMNICIIDRGSRWDEEVDQLFHESIMNATIDPDVDFNNWFNEFVSEIINEHNKKVLESLPSLAAKAAEPVSSNTRAAKRKREETVASNTRAAKKRKSVAGAAR